MTKLILALVVFTLILAQCSTPQPSIKFQYLADKYMNGSEFTEFVGNKMYRIRIKEEHTYIINERNL